MPLMTPFANTIALTSMSVAPNEPLVIDTTPPGENLNTAFTKINENFANVWAAGPVASNIQITNNTISTVDTNGNLILNPNGTGHVVANGDLVPDTTRIRNLGSSSLYWDSLYVWYGNIQNFAVANAVVANAVVANATIGNATITTANITNIGNLTIPVANLHILGGSNGFVLQTDGTGNLSWTAQTGSGNGNPGGSNTQVQFNDSGVFAGSTGFVFNKTSNTLSVANSVVSNQLYAVNGVVFNSRTIAQSFVLDGHNAESVGPVDIGPGAVIDITSGDWVIL